MSNVTHDSIVVKVVTDPDPMNPRTEFENMGTMVCWHRSYTLGDEQPKCDPEEYLNDLHGDCIVVPLYLYDHSGITMSCASFCDRWDSGQVGFIYVTPETVVKEYGDNSKESRDKAEKYIRGEVALYDHYLTGNVWGFVIETNETCNACNVQHTEHVDSCYGFFGDDLEYTGMVDHVEAEYQDAMRTAWDNRF